MSAKNLYTRRGEVLKKRKLLNYKAATDELFRRIKAEDLADAAGVSVASINKARMDPAKDQYQQPPEGWHEGAIVVATRRIAAFKELIKDIEYAGVVERLSHVKKDLSIQQIEKLLQDEPKFAEFFLPSSKLS
jgi:hypothetical protein